MANRWETVEIVNFLGLQNYCSHEIKRRLLLGRKAMTKLDSILKSKDITLLTKVHLVKAMYFPVVMYGCESWTIKKAAHWRIYAFELWCWRRLLRVPWTARRSNQLVQFSCSVVSDSLRPYRLQHTRPPCPVLTVASWPAYRFLRRQVRWTGIPISFRILHSLLWSTQSRALM